MSSFGDRTREAKVARGAPIAESIKLSDLTYPMIRPMSLVSSRRVIEHSAQSISYAPGAAITTFLNSGDDYVFGPGSYFKFNVLFSGADGTFVGDGSAVNCIDSISIYHSSGTLVDRVEAVNLKHSVMQKQTHPADYFLTNAVNYGYGATLTAGTVYKYCIPLGDLHNFWGRKKLIPAMLHSGLKVVIQLSSAATATSTTGGTFLVQNPSFAIDSLTLTDSAQLHLQEISAKQGLVFPFLSHEHISQSTSSGTSYNQSVFRAVSQATLAVAVARTTANVNAITLDSFEPVPCAADEAKVCSVQWKLAGLFMPNKALDSMAEIWTWNQNQMSNDSANRVAPYSVADAKYNGVHMVRLERDHAIKAQGLPVSGSRSLTYSATFGTSVARTVDIFMTFVKLSRCYLFDKVIIQE